MKESFVKAHGEGIGMNLASISFQYNQDWQDDNPVSSEGNQRMVTRASMKIGGLDTSDRWTTVVSKIDGDHVCSVTLGTMKVRGECHDDFSAKLSSIGYDDDESGIDQILEMTGGLTFQPVFLSEMIPQTSWMKLYKARHENTVWPKRSNELKERWVRYVFSPYHWTVCCQNNSKPAMVYAVNLEAIEHTEKDGKMYTEWEPPDAIPSFSIAIAFGNVFSPPERLRRLLLQLRKSFAHVFFCLDGHSDNHNGDTIGKMTNFLDLAHLCDDIAVRTRPTMFVTDQGRALLSIVPLLSGVRVDSDTFFSDRNVEMQCQYGFYNISPIEPLKGGTGGRLKKDEFCRKELGEVISFSNFLPDKSTFHALADQVYTLSPNVHLASPGAEKFGMINIRTVCLQESEIIRHIFSSCITKDKGCSIL
uniref:Uncharacterized protein n=1 Tax=Corethron hystrix TaxID=216773 RepID=A0A7S1BRK1_9STRA|mmetsp:Transcript_38675/g.89855  ORF Transcript_38675/g.89855 Transcript_38675/m.89855 type:complete len:419 (+) Transcript_38675:600-1856(+)